MGYADVLRTWPILQFLKPSFVSNIRTVFVFGDSGDEALIVTNDSKVYGLGSNTAGCLGIATTKSTATPVEIVELCGVSIKTFTCGEGPHVLALTNNGVVFAWGCNAKCQLGTIGIAESCVPFPVRELLANRYIVDIACGPYQSVALADNGMVFFCGRSCNREDKLKLWEHIKFNGPEKVVSIGCTQSFTLLLTDNGKLYYCCNATESQQLLLHGIKKIGCGYSHALCLSTDGFVFTLGDNTFGQLGHGDCLRRKAMTKVESLQSNKIVDIAASNCNSISIAIDTEDLVFIWGLCYGQNIDTPMKCSASNLHDAMAFFGTPSVMHTPLNLYAIKDNMGCDVLESLKMSFNNRETSDLTVKVEGNEIYVHKAILKMRSPYFQTMLKEPWTENNVIDIEVGVFSYNVYEAFLYYLYTDEIRIDVLIDIYSLFKIAHQYILPKLMQLCAGIIKRRIDMSNVVNLFRDVVQHGFEELLEICYDFMFGHTTAIVLKSEFADLPDAVIKIFLLQAAERNAFKA